MATQFKVPASPKRDILEIDNFLGVDLTNSGDNVDERRSPYAPNMIRDVPGKVRKRMGYKVEAYLEGEILASHPIRKPIENYDAGLYAQNRLKDISYPFSVSQITDYIMFEENITSEENVVFLITYIGQPEVKFFGDTANQCSVKFPYTTTEITVKIRFNTKYRSSYSTHSGTTFYFNRDHDVSSIRIYPHYSTTIKEMSVCHEATDEEIDLEEFKYALPPSDFDAMRLYNISNEIEVFTPVQDNTDVTYRVGEGSDYLYNLLIHTSLTNGALYRLAGEIEFSISTSYSFNVYIAKGSDKKSRIKKIASNVRPGTLINFECILEYTYNMGFYLHYEVQGSTFAESMQGSFISNDITYQQATAKTKFATPENIQLIHIGNNLYKQIGKNFRHIDNLNNYPSSAWQMGDKMYLIDGRNYKMYDIFSSGSTFVRYSAYIPTLTIGKATRGGTLQTHRNMKV